METLSKVVRPVVDAATKRVAKNRQPDCERKAFVSGKGDVDTLPSFLWSGIKELSKESGRELLSFVTAITIDSVVLPSRPRHATVLRALADKVRGPDFSTIIGELLAQATTGETLPTNSEKTPIVRMLRSPRNVRLGLRSCASLFFAVHDLRRALAEGLRSIADSIDLFVLEWRSGPAQTRQYKQLWEGGGSSQAELCNFFKEAYPAASGYHEITGICAPLPPQCRPEPFLLEKVLSTGMCSKHYSKAHKFSPGAMTFFLLRLQASPHSGVQRAGP